MVEKLIDNIPEPLTKTERTLKIDLVLEGGAFNGSYMLGVLYFLKKMEEKNYFSIQRISGASVGALLGLIYQMNTLDFAVSFYKKVYHHLKKKKNLSVVHSFCEKIRKILPTDFYLQLNHTFYVTYHDFQKGKKVIKSVYKSNEDVLNTVIYSSYLPFVCGKKCFYKKKYMDGIFPYLFTQEKKGKSNSENHKTLYINLSNYDKVLKMFIIKKEKNNIQRILTGILDAYSFFYHQQSSLMCSYVEKWNLLDKINYLLKRVIEWAIFWSFWLYYLLEKYVLDEMKHTFLHSLFFNLLHHFYKSVIQWYCI